jgi:uncharacterized membrane protein
MSLEILFPFSVPWFTSFLILIVASRPDSLPSDIRSVLASWLGILGTFALGLVAFMHHRILGTAVFILMFALIAEHHKQTKKEYFDNDQITDIVTSRKKWLVEKILDERPIAIVDKQVTTYPPAE